MKDSNSIIQKHGDYDASSKQAHATYADYLNQLQYQDGGTGSISNIRTPLTKFPNQQKLSINDSVTQNTTKKNLDQIAFSVRVSPTHG